MREHPWKQIKNKEKDNIKTYSKNDSTKGDSFLKYAKQRGLNNKNIIVFFKGLLSQEFEEKKKFVLKTMKYHLSKQSFYQMKTIGLP